MTCKEHEFHYYMAPNEDGWRCCLCEHKPGEPPGFDPKLDREHIDSKVYGVLNDLVEAKIVHVSNGTQGDGIVGGVADRCKEAGVFDQYSIALFILEGLTEGHAKYWREVSEGVLSGHDPRDRCPCGALSTCTSYVGSKPPIYRCRDHYNIDADSDVPGYQAPLFPEVSR